MIKLSYQAIRGESEVVSIYNTQENINMDIEIWKDIKGFEGIYQVSNYGKVKSLERTFWTPANGGHWCHWTERILNGGLVGTPIKYRYVILCNNNYRKKVLIHKLVYEAFIGEIPEGMEIDHIDGDSLNNRLDNLQLLSVSDNIKKAKKTKQKKQCSYIITNIKTGEVITYKTIRDVKMDFNLSYHHIRNTAFKKGTTKLLKGEYDIKAIDLIKD